jgi:hypothetical protein
LPPGSEFSFTDSKGRSLARSVFIRLIVEVTAAAITRALLPLKRKSNRSTVGGVL